MQSTTPTINLPARPADVPATGPRPVPVRVTADLIGSRTIRHAHRHARTAHTVVTR